MSCNHCCALACLFVAQSPLASHSSIYEETEQERPGFQSLWRPNAPSDEYVLLVRGDSMIEDHIADGDYVVIKETPEAHDGDIIVATHMNGSGEDGRRDAQTFFREKDRIRLQPANATMEPIYIKAREWDREWKDSGPGAGDLSLLGALDVLCRAYSRYNPDAVTN